MPSSQSASEAPWILLLLDWELGLSVRQRPLDGAFRYRDKLFLPVGGGDFSVFLDRLHDAEGDLAGIEVTPTVADLQFSHGLNDFSYAHSVGREGVFRILFRPHNDAVHLVADQAFGARIFETTDGVSALGFPAYFLTPKEIAHLARLDQASADVVDMPLP